MNNKLIHIFSFFLLVTMTMVSGGCSNADSPTNLEPQILICEATDITRTSAIISATIETPGTSKLDYLRFYYGENDSNDAKTRDLPVDATIISYELKSLKPGTVYYYYAEGGTSTSTLRSETLSFTTDPNDRPKVTSAQSLSTGPTGIIIEFNIEDDGGEQILESGCEVLNLSTQETTRTYLPASELSEGNHVVSITGLTPDTSYEIITFASNYSGESTSEPLKYTTHNGIILHEAGMLSKLLGNTLNLSSLTISGPLNGSDIRYLRALTGAPQSAEEVSGSSRVSVLDLTDAIIVEGGESYDNSRYTQNNLFTTGIFSDCKYLKSITLPNSVTEVRLNAFERCEALETLKISLSVLECKPSEECKSLYFIGVSPANPNYADFEGVLFNKDMTQILWFPLGKTGNFTLPSTLTAIGEKAFIGTHITSLEIPSSVTSIGRGAFSGSALQEITLPDNITNIYEAMFQNCSALHTLRLGAGTEFIGDYAFDGTALRQLYVGANLPPYVSNYAFVNYQLSLFENCTLYVPKGCKAVYRNHNKWKQFNNIEEF